MWKDWDIVGNAVGIRTVSSATRKIERLRAVNAASTWSGGLSWPFDRASLAGDVLGVVLGRLSNSFVLSMSFECAVLASKVCSEDRCWWSMGVDVAI